MSVLSCLPAAVMGANVGVLIGWLTVWYMRRRPNEGDARDSTIDPPDRTK